MLRRLLIFKIIFLLCGAVAWAGGPSLELPLRCGADDGCLAMQYFDHDPGPGKRDYACGFRSYDGHEGTDFRVRDLAVMARGVPVVAAADGVVRAVRDGEADGALDARGREAVAGREAGNAVILVHEGGFETQYSHLRRGSVAVKKGQRVQAGQVLGLVGMSGMAEFPHVELVVRKGLVAVDPFTGGAGPLEPGLCAPGPGALWSPAALEALAYRETDLLDAGFATGEVSMEAIEAGGAALEALAPDAPALVFWYRLAGVREGDELLASVSVPGGKVVARRKTVLDRTRIQYMQFIGGRLAEGKSWAAGRYEGRMLLRRKGPDGAWRTVVDARREIAVP